MIIPSPRSKRKARIEIIPLIDIVFFLLATFVMVSLSMVKNQGVSVKLPAAATGTQQARTDKHTTITITEKAEIYFNKQKVSMEQLRARLDELKRSEPDPTIILNGDTGATLGNAIGVLDEARKRGINKFAIATKQP